MFLLLFSIDGTITPSNAWYAMAKDGDLLEANPSFLEGQIESQKRPEGHTPF